LSNKTIALLTGKRAGGSINIDDQPIGQMKYAELAMISAHNSAAVSGNLCTASPAPPADRKRTASRKPSPPA
jgi:hypothetical protein